ncbi:uncharacterized protein LOC131311059 [Rhododendron vialii]|uniref:uncharacterized protein LOC131311059 n=1 Tax=Rhododendron vialii TaxID=182163 RepID=UPI00265E1A2B|nr:uncharacterized protein LOC131311059 [Rhododendron vialii]XP_058194362.1 uncharacterized protein LOC131311059 [Rhododendron vialii]
MSAHPLCFPNFGEVKINALKVKRKRCFYHILDSMLVKSAFKGAKKCWFVFVDAFSLKHANQFPIDRAVSNQLAVVCFTKTPTGDLYTSSPGIGNPEFASGNTGKDVLNDVEMTSLRVGGDPLNTSILVNNVRSDLGEIQGTHVEYCNDKSRNGNGDVDLNDPLVEAEHSKFRLLQRKSGREKVKETKIF